MLQQFNDVKWGANGPLAPEQITAVCFDSRRLQPGCIFVAIRGSKVDGHLFLKEAAAQGALALVVEDVTGVPADYPGAVIKVTDSRAALNVLAARFFRKPGESLFCIGVTGTNGKTTITHMIEAIFARAGRPAGVIGTIDHHLGEKVWKTELTTPDPLSFQERLRQFVDLGAKTLALEVSSIGLVQSRVDEVPFDVAVFTNLTRDHLDFHRDMEDYFQAKRKLFVELLARSAKPHPRAVINADDEYGRRLVQELGARAWGYGQTADLSFEIRDEGYAGTRFLLRTPRGNTEVRLRMAGRHNIYNAMAAIGAALAADIDVQTCAAALAELDGVKGRLQAVANARGLHVFVDYAHTDDAIRTVLLNLNAVRTNAVIHNKIITVFGCGGDRDRGKRPLMMKAALAGSDQVVVTSDNPRTEDPQQIIADVLAGAAEQSRVTAIVDRREAIRHALTIAAPGDVVLIAGKGHEDYQQIGTVKYPFSDVEVVKEILQ